MSMKKYYSQKLKKGVAMALMAMATGGLFGVTTAEAATEGTWDTILKKYVLDVTNESDVITAEQQYLYVYSYDKLANEIKGAKIYHSDVGKDISLAIKLSDIQTLSTNEIETVLKKLANEKYDYNPSNTVPKVRVVIVDDLNKPVIQAALTTDGNEKYIYETALLITEQIANEGVHNQYAITNNTVDLRTVDKTNIQGIIMLKPEMQNITGIKSVIKGTDSNLTITAINNGVNTSPTLYINAEGKENEKVYGIYNDANGVMTVQGSLTVIQATGKDATGIYAGNNGEEKSKIVLQGPRLTLFTDGNSIEAGKNGDIAIKPTRMTGNMSFGNDIGTIDIRNFGGYGAYAHDGGKLLINDAIIGVDGNKTAVYAEKEGRVIIGYTETSKGALNLSSAGYNKITGKVETDATGTIDLALNNASNDWFKGSTKGNVNLTLENASTWTVMNNSELASLKGSSNQLSAGGINVTNGDVKINKLSGYVNAYYTHNADNPATINGGNINVVSAENGTFLKLVTDNSGIDYSDTSLVENVLDSLTNKLTYSGYINGENNLKAEAHIAEGLTASSISRRYSRISYDKATGAAKRDGDIVVDDANHQGAIVTEKEGGYAFDEDTSIVDTASVSGGPVTGPINASISAQVDKNIKIDMNGNKLSVISSASGSTVGISSISQNEGALEISNVGELDVFAESYGGGVCSAISVNGGGQLIIHNASEGDSEEQLWAKAAKLRGQSSVAANAGGIKSMNGLTGTESKLVIDGLVDILVDAGVEGGEMVTDGNGVSRVEGGTQIRSYGSNEGISAVASTIDVGGGKIIAQNGAWCAIRAYGEFVTDNTGVVNVNVVKDENGMAVAGGDKPVMIEGDFVTSGGMGTKGRISVGLTTPESYWKGNYQYSGGYGVTVGEYGCTNLFMDNGAKWEGSALGTVNAYMDGGSTWSNGISSNKNSRLSIREGASFIPNENSANVFAAINGGETEDAAGNVVLLKGAKLDATEYSGIVNIVCKNDEEDSNKIASGDVTVGSASEGSSIILKADDGNVKALAEKLHYSNYVQGENNVSAKAVIDGNNVRQKAELEFAQEDGQARIAENEVVETDVLGDWKSDIDYKAAVSVNENGVWTGSNTVADNDVTVNGDWNVTGSSSVNNLNANNGSSINMAEAESLNVNKFNGKTTMLYGHDENNPTNIIGGDVVIGSAEEGSEVVLSTDNKGINTKNENQVATVMNNMAGKLTYKGATAGENNLSGKLKIAEGMTASAASIAVSNIKFDENGKGSIALLSGEVEYGAEETAVMRAMKGAMLSSAMMVRAESNDLLKRMGDVRLAEEDRGLWAKYYGGKYEMDKANAHVSYKAYQLGYDTKAGKNWTVGGAVSYNEGKSGKTELKNTAVGVYGTWADDKGQYIDLITKIGWLKNDFDVAAAGHQIEDSLKTTGMSMSAEYGKRFENKAGGFIEPNAELTFAHLNGKKVNAKADGGASSLGVDQDAFNSLVGRLGLRIGHKNAKSSVYAKVALAHEFAGDFDVTFSAPSEPTKKVSVGLKDTWGEFQIGGTTKVGKAGLLYANYQRSFAGDVKEKYRLDAGLRWSF